MTWWERLVFAFRLFYDGVLGYYGLGRGIAPWCCVVPEYVSEHLWYWTVVPASSFTGNWECWVPIYGANVLSFRIGSLCGSLR